VAKAAYSHMEYLIFWALWCWSKRRHPRKNRAWVRKKYLPAIATRSWVFATKVDRDDGKQVWKKLYQLSGTPIQRHRKIKGDYNPFDPADEMYGENPATGASVERQAPPQAVDDPLQIAARDVSGVQSHYHKGNGLARPPHLV